MLRTTALEFTVSFKRWRDSLYPKFFPLSYITWQEKGGGAQLDQASELSIKILSWDY